MDPLGTIEIPQNKNLRQATTGAAGPAREEVGTEGTGAA
jgi:hypothetical protein